MRCCTEIFVALVVTPSLLWSVSAWAPPQNTCNRLQVITSKTPQSRHHVNHDRMNIQMSSEASSPTDGTRGGGGGGGGILSSEPEQLTEEEWDTIKKLYEKGSASSDSSSSSSSLKDVLLEALPTMNPRLIGKIRSGENDSRMEMKIVSTTLNSVLNSRLEDARNLLEELLKAGEIRKLDATIGKAAREGKLDVAFFQVLNMNIVDAAKEEQEEKDNNNKDDEDNKAPEVLDVAVTTRYQILKHVYTRCQEEVEKMIPPGVALLNKLMRTENGPIRANQLQHYLLPQPQIIKTPDGKELELQGGGNILVPHDEFVNAIGNAVRQIRTVERSGGASKVVTAGMVENCRQVAKEARVVIGQHFGRDSEELKNYEEGLQPVFRPDSAESEYIQGE